MDKSALELLDGLNKIMKTIPNVIDSLKKQFVEKYGNEDLVNQYINAITKKDQTEADRILKKLEENGK